MPTKPGASDRELGRQATSDSDAGRAAGHGRGQQRHHQATHSNAPGQQRPLGPRARCRGPTGRTRQVKLALRVTGRCSPGTREDGNVSGPRERLEHFINQGNSPTTDTAVHSQPGAGLQPGRPPFRIPRGAGGPGRRHVQTYGFSRNEWPEW